jgi:hypothetical protein
MGACGQDLQRSATDQTGLYLSAEAAYPSIVWRWLKFAVRQVCIALILHPEASWKTPGRRTVCSNAMTVTLSRTAFSMALLSAAEDDD